MLRLKKKIYILVLAIIIYFFLNFIYNIVIVKKDYSQVYILNEDILQGEQIVKDKLKLVNIKNSDNKYITSLKEEYRATTNIYSGEILTYNNVKEKAEYLELNKDKEIISIKLENLDDTVSNKITRGSIVNIYYTGMTNQLNETELKTIQKKITSTKKSEGYTTFKLLENISIIGAYDTYGNILEKNSNSLISYINIEVDSTVAEIINNLKKYGEFSLTLKEG